MNDSISTNTDSARKTGTDNSILVRIGLAAAIAAIVNVLLFWVGGAAGASFDVNAPGDLNATMMALASAIPLLVMGVAVWLLERRYALRNLAKWAGLIFALLTIASSILASADMATALTLSAMHVVAGFAWFFALGE